MHKLLSFGVFLVVTTILPSRADDTAGVVSKPTMRLTGGVVHSEHLAPVPSSQMPGKIFNPAAAFGPASKAPAKKFAIPSWLAGVWVRSQSTETSRINLVTHQHEDTTGTSVSKATDKFGTYVDGDGQIWQIFDPRKAFGQIDRGNFIDYHRVSTYEFYNNGDKVVIIGVTASHLVVNKKTHKIISTFQDEELNTYTQLADGHVRTDSSVKVFDAHGKPIYLTQATSTETRLTPFKG
ncbi:MAG TPA: hypothetical protein V6C89_15065 [Drouetiella sp.]